MKIINKLQYIKNKLLKRGLAFFAIAILSATAALCQLPTAPQLASQMKVGWNLGNTLEAICGETAWSNPATTQTLINSVKAAGFNTIRIPCAWDCHTASGVIDAAWIARVKQVVDYCISNNMYVILNIHWDGGWLDNNITQQKQSSVNAKQQNYWTQIANYFKAYDEHLLFASANEPPVSDATAMGILLSYHQTFIDAVRATGGNNSSRTLIVQGASADIDKTNTLMNTMPTDQIANRLMVEIHYYTPYQFCLMEADETWGVMAYYWGNGYHSTTETSRNATWGEEGDVEYYFGLMKTKFVDNGIPVILGEFAAMKRTAPADLSLHLASRAYYHKYIVSSAIAKGIIPYYWDHGQSAFALFDRNTGAVVDQQNLDAIMQGAGSTTVSVTGVTLSPTTATIAVGGTSQLTATVAPSNATNKTVSWSSNNTSVATVSSAGLVTGVAAGTATITVTTQDGGKTASSSITVTTGSVAVTGVSVNPSTASVSVGGTSQLTATVAPSNATNKTVSWSSSNTSVATVSSTGLVTGVAAGSAIISVTTQDGSFTASSTITVSVPSCTLPTGWSTSDIGTVGATGSACENSGTFTVQGAGSDIWGTSDAFRFVYKSISGDNTIIAKVNSVSNTDPWAKAGVMIRETLTTGSKNACMFLTPGNGAVFQYRTTNSTSNVVSAGKTAPYWVKLTRSGNTITGYISTDGLSWTSVGNKRITMATNVYMGLAVTSHVNATLCTSVFSNVSTQIGVKSAQVGIDGITQNQPSDINVYPNPVTDNQVTLSGIDGQANVRLTDINGRIIQEGNITINGTFIYKLNVTPGFYVMYLVNGKNNIQKKLIVR